VLTDNYNLSYVLLHWFFG